ncbi:outer membrane beta-barrel protein [Thiofilum flexile]|uniref:outer membrane beta-barrel protein n=1 Tax=Thiofilum flexile TaxID=125627 RepID=UPI00037DCD63|nr:outer membrane beta-barrel protein [Thiofilum flexile]
MKKYLIALAWIAVANASASAADLMDSKNLYVGGNLGTVVSWGNLNDCGDDSYCLQGKALVGYKLNDSFAVEGAFHQLLDVTYRNGMTLAVTGLSVSAVGSMPVANKTEAFGRLGIMSGRNIVESASGGSASSDRTDVLWGGGLQYKMNDNMKLRGEYENFQSNANSLDIGILSAGITFSSF